MAYWLGEQDSAQMVDRVMAGKSESFDCSMLVPRCRENASSSLRRLNPFNSKEERPHGHKISTR